MNAQIFVDGLFNGDPHPGNILAIQKKKLIEGDPTDPGFKRWLHDDVPIEDDDWVPVLLDFGLTKTLDDKNRIAFSKMAAAVDTLDFAMILESQEEMVCTDVILSCADWSRAVFVVAVDLARSILISCRGLLLITGIGDVV